MAISLEKGQKVELTKTNPGLKKIKVGLGWDIKKPDAGIDFDLDALAFLLNSTDKVRGEKDLVFYNNLKHESGAVVHSGDNKTGLGEGDDEMITLEFDKVPADVNKISFAITIHDAEVRKQNFGMVSNAFVRVVDLDTNVELVRYDLGEDYSTNTAVIAGDVYRHQDGWKFNAIGSGFQGGLAALMKNYGI